MSKSKILRLHSETAKLIRETPVCLPEQNVILPLSIIELKALSQKRLNNLCYQRDDSMTVPKNEEPSKECMLGANLLENGNAQSTDLSFLSLIVLPPNPVDPNENRNSELSDNHFVDSNTDVNARNHHPNQRKESSGFASKEKTPEHEPEDNSKQTKELECLLSDTLRKASSDYCSTTEADSSTKNITETRLLPIELSSKEKKCFTKSSDFFDNEAEVSSDTSVSSDESETEEVQHIHNIERKEEQNNSDEDNNINSTTSKSKTRNTGEKRRKRDLDEDSYEKSGIQVVDQLEEEEEELDNLQPHRNFEFTMEEDEEEVGLLVNQFLKGGWRRKFMDTRTTTLNDNFKEHFGYSDDEYENDDNERQNFNSFRRKFDKHFRKSTEDSMEFKVSFLEEQDSVSINFGNSTDIENFQRNNINEESIWDEDEDILEPNRQQELDEDERRHLENLPRKAFRLAMEHSPSNSQSTQSYKRSLLNDDVNQTILDMTKKTNVLSQDLDAKSISPDVNAFFVLQKRHPVHSFMQQNRKKLQEIAKLMKTRETSTTTVATFPHLFLTRENLSENSGKHNLKINSVSNQSTERDSSLALPNIPDRVEVKKNNSFDKRDISIHLEKGRNLLSVLSQNKFLK